MSSMAEAVAAVAPHRIERVADPCVMVIFGASGDLMQRKLMPALYRLAQEKLLPPRFSVIGNSRRDMSDQAFREQMRNAVASFEGPVDDGVWRAFESCLHFVPGSTDDPETYLKIAECLGSLQADAEAHRNRLFYLAVPPSLVLGIAQNLKTAGLSKSDGWTRIIVEKPFGHDLKSARELNDSLHDAFDDDQIYRIDHYLGKETVQNLLVFRFANGIFEPIWNRRYVDQVQITAAETVGVEGRGTYYEEAGALRDMVQNHLIQLMSLTAMEPPAAFDSESVRSEKLKVLRAASVVNGSSRHAAVARGQYSAGRMNGSGVPGYRQEPGVDPKSRTETFVALRMQIDNWRWAGVPFYLRAGKRMRQRWTEIAIQFKQPPLTLFGGNGCGRMAPNLLSVRIQPDEGISLAFAAKVPGPGTDVRPVDMDFRYATTFGMASQNAYERLLLDCMLGDATLFARREGVELAWALLDPILNHWKQDAASEVPLYAAGSWGPGEADDILLSGHRWRNPTSSKEPCDE